MVICPEAQVYMARLPNFASKVTPPLRAHNMAVATFQPLVVEGTGGARGEGTAARVALSFYDTGSKKDGDKVAMFKHGPQSAINLALGCSTLG